ncbi:MAG TPA: TraB/GumN family protein [Noviherbaspirillum sp.]|nr:TraB/GumN family protein [Noviherbaspirillum sp.]
MKLWMTALLSAALLAPAHAGNDAAAAVTIQAGRDASVAAPTRGALYRVRHEGTVSYLFGTIHVGTPAHMVLDAEVERALMQSRRLVLELDVRDDAPVHRALEKHGLYSPGTGIDRHLDADTLRLLKDALERFGLAYEAVQGMKPWLVANLLQGLELDRNGFRRHYGAEYNLIAFAPGHAVLELETAEYQMALFDGMSAAAQEEYLRETLQDLQAGRALRKARELIDAWASADRDTLARLWQESLTEGSRTAEFTHRVLLDERNPLMADKVEILLKERESSFVAVGLLHLIGKNGLPALLRQRGYSVERVY